MWTDADEVLFDFQTPVFEMHERLHGKKLTALSYPGDYWDMFLMFSDEERKAIFAECGQPGWCRSLKPLPGAVDAIKEIREHLDLFCVTSHFHSKTWVHERDASLIEHFGFKKPEIVHTGAKFLVSADAMLDDKPDHVLAWSAEHPDGMAMLWPIPNTRNMPLDEFRVRGWDDVVARVKAFEKRDSALDLLDEREWQREGEPYAAGNFCLTCGGTERGSKIPTHKPGCRLDEVLTRYRRAS
jgi:5'(3')-deoxyribonucleotidase